ncbi:MAG: 3-dehydroquinate synthase [Syntrophomonadaceae bacterium]|nr:3-dehydroquinate synthase [Syntrophomonadaceae bacterium]MDD3022859.1 3-dehydroquinate synthase [Syntrophomonadaceae bacterium]
MTKLPVKLGERSYKIFIGAGNLERAGILVRSISEAQKILLVSNPTVFNIYGPPLVEVLQANGFETIVALMPDGEEYKNMEEALKILDQAVDSRLERSSILLALGGGVVGDLAGFVASIYQRGIDFVQIPTTLLAQVDSSVGGKVAVNHPLGKNFIGSFHQPRMVIIDSQTLDTLVDREYYSGLGEVVKYGIIYDRHFFSFMETNAAAIRSRDKSCIETLIYRCCEIKAEIVEQDERELGIRAILNLGHTFGHSLEKLGLYQLYKHGEAVVTGTIMASCLALDLKLINDSELMRIVELYKQLGIIPPRLVFTAEDILKGMLNDKKTQNRRLRFVLPRGIGKCLIKEDIEREQLIKAIEVTRQIEVEAVK